MTQYFYYFNTYNFNQTVSNYQIYYNTLQITMNQQITSIFNSNLVSKIIQTIIHLRIDLKKQTVHQLNKLFKQTHYSHQAFSQFLENVLQQDFYTIRKEISQVQRSIHKNNKIQIIFTMQSKKCQKQIIFEKWEVEWSRKSIDPNVSLNLKYNDEQYNTEERDLMIELVRNLTSLPFWKDCLQDNEKRKRIRQNYFLNYRIDYKYQQLENATINYNCKIQKIKNIDNIQLRSVVYYVRNIGQLLQIQKSNIKSRHQQKIQTKLSQQTNSSSRKRTLYSFYDQQLDIFFVSSQNESPLKKNSVVIIQEEQIKSSDVQHSDQEYIMVIDVMQQQEREDKKRKQLLQEMRCGYSGFEDYDEQKIFIDY